MSSSKAGEEFINQAHRERCSNQSVEWDERHQSTVINEMIRPL